MGDFNTATPAERRTPEQQAALVEALGSMHRAFTRSLAADLPKTPDINGVLGSQVRNCLVVSLFVSTLFTSAFVIPYCRRQ